MAVEDVGEQQRTQVWIEVHQGQVGLGESTGCKLTHAEVVTQAVHGPPVRMFAHLAGCATSAVRERRQSAVEIIVCIVICHALPVPARTGWLQGQVTPDGCDSVASLAAQTPLGRLRHRRLGHLKHKLAQPQPVSQTTPQACRRHPVCAALNARYEYRARSRHSSGSSVTEKHASVSISFLR